MFTVMRHRKPYNWPPKTKMVFRKKTKTLPAVSTVEMATYNFTGDSATKKQVYVWMDVQACGCVYIIYEHVSLSPETP